MADNTLDSLNIQISASASKAVRELNNLSGALSGLTTNLDPVAAGLEKVTQQLNNIIGYNGGVASLAKSFKSLSTSWTGLMSVNKDVNPFEGLIVGLERLQGINLSDSLANLDHIRDAVGKLGGKYSSTAADNLINMANALRQWEGVQIPNYGGLAYLASSLSEFGKKKLTDGFDNLIRLKVALGDFEHIHIDQSFTASVQQLADALYKFGLAKMEKATANIPALANGLKSLISSLSNMPQVSENTIRLVTALGNLNISGNQLNKAIGNVSGGLKRYQGHALNARKASLSLASAFGKMYANFFLVFRLINRLKKDIDLSSQLTEVQNVVDVTFGDMADKMNDFAKSAVDTLGMSELTAKQIGSKFQAMGKAMGISPAMVKSTNEFVQKATEGYADVAEGMADISINLTKLAGDMASFYNQDYEEVAEKLQAIFTGQTRPLRAYGIDLTQATLQEWALKNGMDANIKTMTQAEKTLLRYKYVMAQTTAAQGDFQRTTDTWANQVRIASEKLNQLRIILGKIAIYTFKPLVKSFNEAMNEILKGAEGLLNALGKIFGWKIEWSDAGALKEEADDADDLANGMGDAADNAKKFKNFLLGIDELNLLPDNNDKDGGKNDGLGGLTGGLDDLGKFNITPVESGFESLYDTLYKLGKRIAEIEKGLLKGIDWDKIYSKARKFGKGFASFLNGYLSDVELFYHKGRTLANGINTIAHAIDAFFKEFDGRQFGFDRAMELNGFTSNLDWKLIKSAVYEMAHDIAEYFNGFIENVNWRDVGRTLIEGVNTAVLFGSTIINEVEWAKLGSALGEAINGIFANWDEEEMARLITGAIKGALDLANNFLRTTDFELLGQKLGHFLSELDLSQFAAPLADLILNLIKAAFNMLGTMALEAPLETALIAAFAGAKFLGLGGALGTTISSAIKSAFISNVGSLGTDGAVLNAAKSTGASIGTAIAASIVTAYVGYGVGTKIGKELSKGKDDMWYDTSPTQTFKDLFANYDEQKGAWTQMFADMILLRNELSDTDSAFKAFSNDVSAEAAEMLLDIDGDFAEFDVKTSQLLKTAGTTWGQIKDSLRMGKVELDTEDFDRLKEMLSQSGVAANDAMKLINELKDAQEEYYQGFSDYLLSESALGQTREQAYAQYNNMRQTVEEWITTHEKERKAIESGAMTYEEVYNTRIPNAIKGGLEKAARETIKGFGAVKEESKKIADDTEKSYQRVEKSSAKGGQAFNSTLHAMTDMRDKSSLAMSGVINLSDKLKDVSQTQSGIKNVANEFKTLDTNVTTLNTNLTPVKVGFNEFAMQTQANMLNLTNVIGQAFNGIMKYGNQTIAWLKSSFIPYFSSSYWSTITSGIPSAFGNAFKQAINIMMNLWKQFSTWANDNMKIKVNMKGKEITGIEAKVPQYSTGGFPSEDGVFMANHSEMIGQFSNGKTAVANNEQIVEGIRQGVYEAVSAAMQNGGQGVTVELVGDASDIFTAVVRENNRTIMRTGTSPIRN